MSETHTTARHFLTSILRHLSRHPVPYALAGAIGIALFWKGLWDIAQQFLFNRGMIAIALGVLVLLVSAFVVSLFITNALLASEKKHDNSHV